MIGISKIHHIGIRVRDKHRAIAFYEGLGFAFIGDAGFESGRPVTMRHPSGIMLNLDGPSSEEKDENVLMDLDHKYAGYTHMALRVESLAAAEGFLAEKGIEISGRFSTTDMNAILIRDPDRNMLEFNEHRGDDIGAE